MKERNKEIYTVYCITNGKNGRQYIGCTCRLVFDRIGRHRQDLRRGVHANDYMQTDWNALNFEFKFHILATFSKKSEALAYEAQKIAEAPNSYNIQNNPEHAPRTTLYGKLCRRYVYTEVEDLLHNFEYTTRRINAIFGISPGMIANIRHGKVKEFTLETSFAYSYTDEMTRLFTQPAHQAESYSYYKDASQ